MTKHFGGRDVAGPLECGSNGHGFERTPDKVRAEILHARFPGHPRHLRWTSVEQAVADMWPIDELASNQAGASNHWVWWSHEPALLCPRNDPFSPYVVINVAAGMSFNGW